MTTEENVSKEAPVVHNAEVVTEEIPREASRSFLLPPTLPTAPGQAKNSNAPLEDCSAEVIGVRVPGGATLTRLSIGPHKFTMHDGVSIDQQLRELRPRCPRMSFIMASVRNDTAEVQSFQTEVFLANIDVNAAVPQIGGRGVQGRGAAPAGSSVARTTQKAAGVPSGARRGAPVTVNIPSRPGQVGAVVTSTPGPRRQLPPPAYVPRKSGAKFGPTANRSATKQVEARPERAKGMNVVAGRGWNRRAVELVLLHLEKGHLVPQGSASMVAAYWKPFADALGEDAPELLRSIRMSRRVPGEQATEWAAKIREAANPTTPEVTTEESPAPSTEEKSE